VVAGDPFRRQGALEIARGIGWPVFQLRTAYSSKMA
jgi:hypothetical protein